MNNRPSKTPHNRPLNRQFNRPLKTPLNRSLNKQFNRPLNWSLNKQFYWPLKTKPKPPLYRLFLALFKLPNKPLFKQPLNLSW